MNWVTTSLEFARRHWQRVGPYLLVELLLPGGAFPKWPLLFLTAVPLVFIHDCETCDTPPEANSTPTPTPNSTPTPTPEPASLLLLGTGLLATGAGLRRRRNRKS